MSLKVKQRIPLKIKKMGINGEGIGFYKKTLVFVPGALKGEDIFCQVTTVKRNFVEAKLLTINKHTKYRVEPPCEIYEKCGGCQIMHLHYDKQLEFKTDLLRQALKKFAPAGYENYEIRPTIGMQEPLYYRAKLQFQTRKLGDEVKAGLYAQNSHYLISLKNCLVQDKVTQKIINKVALLLGKYNLPIYDERKRAGVRTVMIRRARKTGQVQMIFVTGKKLDFSPVIRDLTAEFPELETVAVNYHTTKSSEIYGDKTEIIWGKETIQEGVLDYEFSLSPRAFYQLNPEQTLFLGGLGRFDFVAGDKQGFTAYFDNELKLHRTKLAGAGEFYEKHVGSLLTPPSKKEVSNFPQLVKHELKIEAKTDVVFSGLGWIRVIGPAQIAVWAPEGVAVVTRKAII